MASSNQQPTSSSSSSLYPSLDMKDLAENLFPDEDPPVSGHKHPDSSEQVLLQIPGAILHLIERQNSIELASGEFSIVGLIQGNNVVAVLARIGDQVQWPLAKDEPAVKLDDSHYFFTLSVPSNGLSENPDSVAGKANQEPEMLNYGLTVASKGQEDRLKELDRILDQYSCFSVQKMEESARWEVLDGSVAKEISPEDMAVSEEKRELLEERSAAYWTTLAPNVDDYSGKVARLIAAGSGRVIKGILWCGDVTVDRLNWGNEFMKKRMGPRSDVEISSAAMKSIKSVKKMTKMTEKVATGILSGVVKVSGFFTSSIVNSKVGKKFFSLLPGEIVLASLDGFNKVCDAVEVAGKNVMSTTSVVTTGLVSERYGEEAAKATNEGLGAAGHAIGTAWAVLKIRKALNPKSAFKPTTLVKAAAAHSSSSRSSK
ncbi:protein EARLY-RESPONSIVE TO DEHYDRATION 7 [Cucumis melo var. makuwa]|uniref:Protein EARLY-RESPONSIVE TO DEHYDRATION 7 n=2 Tax=Cucumis melo TaxID=3656 RepID=A0A5D3BKR6_CUCMM|nr:protein EARLY-RESPONSIVE TO DEHYDRATION 7 [Cucumis melo var. makuwa]TYJ99549.1 protein EARLY-RESPONSIVE TO DEHYDRATION 7 [Cucumis melo var. makuwa]